MRERLEEPVEYGDLRLAPTIELAGLAELSAIVDDDDRIEALLRIAAAVRAEDEARDELRRVRSAPDAVTLPHRRR